jgi:large subunit ribosomal protein L43
MPRLIPLASAAPRTLPVTGYQHFLTPLRKLIFDYDPLSPAQGGIRYVATNPIHGAATGPDSLLTFLPGRISGIR